MTQLEYNQLLKEFVKLNEKLNLILHVITGQNMEIAGILNKIAENAITKDELKKLKVEIEALKDEKEACLSATPLLHYLLNYSVSVFVVCR